MARLAFVVSDVIIFIWNESFANHSYLERVKKLVHQSSDQIDSAYSPSLILIYNKASLDEEMDVEACTKNFFENEENLVVKEMYHQVKCICLPHTDQMKKIRGTGGQKTMFIDGEEIYNLQIEKLKEIIKDMLNERTNQKQKMGYLCSEKVWCTLFATVILNFEQKLRMAEILTNIMRPKNIISSKSFMFFHHLYNYSKNYSKQNFLIIREASMEMLLCLYVFVVVMWEKVDQIRVVFLL